MMIPVSIKDDLPFHVLIDFVVVENQDSHVQLKIKQISDDDTSILKDKVIEELKLPKNSGMRECIQQFINDETPLGRLELLKTYHLANKYKLPLPVILQIGDKLGLDRDELFGSLEKAINYPLKKQVETLRYLLFEDMEIGLVDKLKNSVIFLGQYNEPEGIILTNGLRQQMNHLLK